MDNELDKQQKIENKSVFEQMFLNNLIKIIKSQSCLKGSQQISKVISKINNDLFLSKISIDWEKYLSIFFHYLDQMKNLLIENIEIVKDQINNINSQKRLGFNLYQIEANLTNSKLLLKELEDDYLSKLESLNDFNYQTYGYKLDPLASEFMICLDSCGNYNKFSENNKKISTYFLKISDSIWTPYLTFCKDEIDKLFNDKNINFYKGIFYIYVNRDALNKGFNESISSIAALFIRQAIEDSSLDESKKFSKNAKNIKLEKIKLVLEKIHTDKLELKSKGIDVDPHYNSLKNALKNVYDGSQNEIELSIVMMINIMLNSYIHKDANSFYNIIKLGFRLEWILNDIDDANYVLIRYVLVLFIKSVYKKNNNYYEKIISPLLDLSVFKEINECNNESKDLFKEIANKDEINLDQDEDIEILLNKTIDLYYGPSNGFRSLDAILTKYEDEVSKIEEYMNSHNAHEIIIKFLNCCIVVQRLLSTPFLFVLYALLLDNKITKEEMHKALNYTLFVI